MNDIETFYREKLGQWTGRQRVARTAALFEEVRSMIRCKIETAEPALDERQVRIRVAQSLYRTDPETQRLLALLDG